MGGCTKCQMMMTNCTSSSAYLLPWLQPWWNLSKNKHAVSVLVINCCESPAVILYFYEITAVVVSWECGGGRGLAPWKCRPPAHSHKWQQQWVLSLSWLLLKTSVVTQRNSLTVHYKNESSCFHQSSVNLTLFQLWKWSFPLNCSTHIS